MLGDSVTRKTRFSLVSVSFNSKVHPQKNRGPHRSSTCLASCFLIFCERLGQLAKPVAVADFGI